MKKLISSVGGSSVLSKEQMKKILGGAGDGTKTACTGLTEDKCSIECIGDNGYEGRCGWTEVPTGRCTCGSSGA